MTLQDFQRRVDALTQMRVVDVTTPVLSKDDAHHLFKVLRAEEGEEIVVTNGKGQWAFAKVGDKVITRTSDVVTDPEPTPTELFIVPLKGDKSELAVSKMVERRHRRGRRRARNDGLAARRSSDCHWTRGRLG